MLIDQFIAVVLYVKIQQRERINDPVDDRLCFSVASAPCIFQSVIDQVLLNMKNVSWFYDDILVGGSTEEECKQNLFKVFSRLIEHNIKIKLNF